MRLQHYVGGLEGLPQPLILDKRVFAEDWEQRIFGIHVAMMGLSSHLSSALPGYPLADVPTEFHHKWTWAHLRTAAEAMNPFDYFKYRYYEKWLGGVTEFLIDKGYLTEQEITSRTAELTAARTTAENAAIDEQVLDYLRHGDSPRRDVAHPRFTIGQRVRIADVPAADHTRLPGFLRARIGTVRRVFEGDYAYFVHTGDGIGDPMPVYLVEFTPEELWGERAEPGANILSAELFEAYLRPLEEHQ